MSQTPNTQPKLQRKTAVIGLFLLLITALLVGLYANRGRWLKPKEFVNPVLQEPILSSASNTPVNRQENARLHIQLSEGKAATVTFDPLTIAAGEPLSEDEINQILLRLPELTGQEGDVQSFNLPDSPIPPPRPGQTITQTFPSPETGGELPVVAEGPLQVLRYSPEGDVGLAPFINVTFNQPMVPLTDLQSLDATAVPVQLTPNLPGRWQWVSPQTLRFELDSNAIDRLPMATEFVAEIPAGTSSITGNQLAETVRWTFTTPPLQMVDYAPSNQSQPVDPLIFLTFDQRIDATAVLNSLQVTVNGQSHPVRLASSAEIAADEQASQFVERSLDGRWLILRPERPFANDSEIVVTIPAGAPSAEGPRLTSEAQSFSFRTYPPLRINSQRCWYSGECPPLTPFTIDFSNELDPATFDASMVQIAPELPQARVSIRYNSLVIEGLSAGGTTYFVTIDGRVQDIFGQTLGNEQTRRFTVGHAQPHLSGTRNLITTLDPLATTPSFSVYSINYDQMALRVYAVTPDDWGTYIDYRQNRDNLASFGEPVLDQTIDITHEKDVLTETAVDLSSLLNQETNHFVVHIEPVATFKKESEREQQTVLTWLQMTQIGLDVLADNDRLVVWATNLQDGSPLANVNITTYANEANYANNLQAVTGADGIAHIPLTNYIKQKAIIAEQGNDSAILPNNNHYYSTYDGWQHQDIHDNWLWHVLDDRGIYQPGEELHIKGWVRLFSVENQALQLPGTEATAVTYQIFDSQGNKIADNTAVLNSLGGFDIKITLPDSMNLGYSYIDFSLNSTSDYVDNPYYSYEFQVEEFRRPEFEVTVQQESSPPYIVQNPATVSAAANYFAGGALPGAEVTWTVSSQPTNYTPPNWSDFVFGTWTPWWYNGRASYDAFYYDPNPQEAMVETFNGLTDGMGKHYLQLDFTSLEGQRPFAVNINTAVMDVNRQTWAASTSLLVHPAELYVGLRSQRTFVKPGEPLQIELIVTDIDGQPVPNTAVELKAALIDWQWQDGILQEMAFDEQSCNIQSSTDPVMCSFSTPRGGTYQITAVVTDAQGRQNQSQFTRWVSGGTQRPVRNIEQESVTLIPDKEFYQLGDVAEILVQAPFTPAQGLLTMSQAGIIGNEQFSLEDGSYTLRIPITEAHIPNLNVQVDLVGSAARTDDQGQPIANIPPRPAYATGSLTLNVPPYSRELTVDVSPSAEQTEPGSQTAVTLTVTDANGQLVPNAEVALIVADEAVLTLTNYQLANPLDSFYNTFWHNLQSSYGRGNILLHNPQQLIQAASNISEVVVETVVDTVVETVVMTEMEEMAAPAMAYMEAGAATRDDAASNAPPITVRSDFNPLAIFAPVVQTNSQGQAEVSFTLPDNLTRYRIMAVAVNGNNQFGIGESNLTARLPLMVRPSAPRFLNFGDQFELPVVLQNQTNEPMTVDVVVQTSNLLLTEGNGRRVTVPANDRVEVRFPATTLSAGTARFQVAAVAGNYADAATIDLPVYTPATTEAFATYGVIDDGAISQPFQLPEAIIDGYGGLEMSTSSTAVQSLTDAVLYLTNYPYTTADAIASRILAVATLRDVLTAFSAEGLPAPDVLESAVSNNIRLLAQFQTASGGFGFWQQEEEAHPFTSIHVAHALVVAAQKGFSVPAPLLERSQRYLQNIEQHYPSWYSENVKRTLSAYALHVRYLNGDSDVAKAATLLNKTSLDETPLEVMAWLWPILAQNSGYANDVAAIRQHINNRAVETAVSANFTTSYGEQDYLLLHSNRRTDAVVLQALIEQDPDNDLIPKIVHGLQSHRVKGHWRNTQENLFVLLALDSYFNTYEAVTPDFVAQLWLGNTFAGEQSFVGRSTDSYQIDIPMTYLTAALSQEQLADLIVSKTGDGRLYYRLGFNYAPADLELDALSRGFVVQRSYEAVDNPDDVYRDADGNWHIKLGAQVRIKLTVVADNRRYHVALVDPLPAGLEAINTALTVSPAVISEQPEAPSPYWWRWGNWYQHQNVRDERIELFTYVLWEGVYEYEYVTQATTPGTFVVPPAKAEEMYSPEVFGRSQSDLVIIEE